MNLEWIGRIGGGARRWARSTGITVVAAGALATVPFIGCDRGADSGWAGSIETLENGAVRVTNPVRGVWDGTSGWALEPELVLGELDGSEATTFAEISGLETDADGRIYVLDRQANQLRIFDASGAHVRSVGRSGGGPGEYSNANGLLWASGDTLLVVDQRGERYTLLTRDGDYVRSVPRRLGFFGWAANVAYHDGRAYEQSAVRAPDVESRPALMGTQVGSVRLLADGDATVAQPQSTTLPDVPIDTVLLPVHPAPQIEAFSIQTDRGGMVMGVPFAPGAVYHLTRDGRLWHGHGSEFRLVESELSGDTIREILLDAHPVPVAQDELDSWLAGEGVARYRDMGGRLDVSRIPSTKPLFNRIVTEAQGHIWAVLSAPAGETAFAVFDPEGRYLGRLTAAGLNLVSWVPPVIRNDRLYVIGRDELDVQRVYVYRIFGRPATMAAG